MANPQSVIELVENCTGGKSGQAEINEGLSTARVTIVDMLDKKEIKPIQLHFGQLMESFCNVPGSDFYKKWGAGGIERAASQQALQDIAEAVAASGDFPIITQKFIHSELIPAYDEQMLSIADLFTEIDSNNETQFHAGLIDVDEPDRTPEGEYAPEGSPIEKSVEIKNHKVTRLTAITQETILFDKSGGAMLDRVRNAGGSMGRMRRRWIIRLIQDLSFTTNNFDLSANSTLKYDGETRTLFSTNHSSIDGQTNSNLLSAAGRENVTTTNLQDGDDLLGLMTDFHGRILNLGGDTVLVPRKQKFAAFSALNSDFEFDTSNRNTVNPIKMTGAASKQVADANVAANTWFYGNFKLQYVWQWVQREFTNDIGPELKRGVVRQFLSGFHGGFGARDYRLVIKYTT